MKIIGREFGKQDLLLIIISIIISCAVALINTIVSAITLCFLIILFFANKEVYYKNTYICYNLFTKIGRNYKHLVISDWYKYTEQENIDFLVLKSPTARSRKAIYELVKRLYSLLDEDGGELIIICHRKHKDNNKFSIFDIPYLHDITLYETKNAYMKRLCKYPLLFSPVGSIKLLTGYCSNKSIESVSCAYDEITTFCKERNIKLIFKYIK